MGFFSEPCWVCATSVKKSLRFCPDCGAPASKSEFACPRCNGSNKGPMRHCTHCGGPLLDEKGKFIDRPLLVESNWAREPDDFAVRLHVQDVPGRFAKWVVIEEGTTALVFQDGRYAGSLDPGRHNHTGLAQRIAAWFNLATPAMFVLVDSADVNLDLQAECLTSENLPVAVDARVVLSLGDPLAFYQNLMKSRTRMRKGELERVIEKGVMEAAQAEIRSVSLKDLPGNLKIRDGLLDVMTRYLSPTLARTGLRFVHVSSLSFESEDLKRLVGKAREVFDVRETSLVDVQVAEVEAARIRGVEVARAAEHEADVVAAKRGQELDLSGARHEVAKKAVEDDYKRESDRKDQEAQIDVFNRKRESDLAVWKKQQETDLEVKKQKLALYASAPLQALAAILEGPEFERVMKVEELRSHEKMSPEHMLIFVAGKSPEVARALAQKYIADGSLKTAQAEKIFAEQKAELSQKMAEKTVDRIADVAGAKSGAACSNCGRAVTTPFCPHCGAKRG